MRHRRIGVATVAALACAAAPAPAAAVPVAGKAIDVGPHEFGKAASIKCPGDAAFAKVTAPRTIPLGCEIDMTNGGLAITTARADGTPQTGQFTGRRAHVKLTQAGDTGVLTLVAPFDCKRGPVEIFADSQGPFRTVGRYGSATGTGAWRTEENCDAATVFRAGERTLEIRDFPARKTVQLRRDRSYTAGAQSSCGNLIAMPARSPYSAITITVSGITCARARGVLVDWIGRLPPYKGKKTKPFPTKAGGWTFDATLEDRSLATRGVAAIGFKLITTFFARP